MDKINLTNHQITNIAEANDLGLDVFINVKTNEIIELPNLLNGPIMEFNEYHSENLEKVEYNWHNIEKIECPNSNESYRIMSSFVDELSESSLKSKLSNALNDSLLFKK